MNNSFNELITGYLNNSLNDEELRYLLDIIKQKEYEQKLKDKISGLLHETSGSDQSDKNREELIFNNIILLADAEEKMKKEHDERRKARIVRFRRIAIAASIIGLIASGTHLVMYVLKKESNKISIHKYKNDVPPGRNKAILTLADGSSIVLDDAKDGAITQQGGVKIIKIGGKLSYHTTNKLSNEIEYNTITTPRGGQYQLQLPDGSRVWINAASSLRFPTAFTGNERRVEINGEAYFEVAKNKSMPFIVKANDAEVQVLGTHFNVMAYDEEDVVNTTLLEGAVKFVSGDKISILKPGEQSQLSKNGQLKLVNDVDVDQVVAWKNGLFVFDNSELGTVMRQLSRWYDIDVVYRTKNVTTSFVGEIPRTSSLSDVLKVIELTSKLHFEILGKKVIVM
jgi:transmembrane sensor